MTRDLIVQDRFFPGAQKLRGEFEGRFENPHQSTPGRFVWDWWHVPAQYTLLRTPAYHFFSKKIYDTFHQQLAQWGREHLGCHDISPPWLSCYVDGCEQRLHADVPHGPWAFVYSLTPWTQRTFRGGETLLMNSAVLEYWNKFPIHEGVEEDKLLRKVAPKFNRLVVFDPRIPHGVRPINGSADPREGRLVIHGWFMNPRPYIQGPLKERALSQAIAEISDSMQRNISRGTISAHGTLCVRFGVSAAGKASSFSFPTDNLRSRANDSGEIRRIKSDITRLLSAFHFPRHSKTSKVTLPLSFE